MNRKEKLRAALSARERQLPGGNSGENAASQPEYDPPPKPKPLVRSGAVGAMGRSLGQIASAAEQARALVASGEAIVELEPKLVETSFVSDRLELTEGGHESLVASIREHGQQVPILVRPHPAKNGRYQVAYGHRRLRAAAALNRPVRAVVKPLSDEELVVAQGQENSARTDLSYIERALFAAALEDRGFDRAVIMAALTMEKTQLSRLIAVARSIPSRVAAAVGPAPKAGRPRWVALAERLEKSGSQAVVDRALSDPQFHAADTDARFVRLFEALAPRRDGKTKPTTWKDDTGVQVARIERGDGRLSLTLDQNVAPNFGEYLVDRLPELYRAYRAVREKE